MVSKHPLNKTIGFIGIGLAMSINVLSVLSIWVKIPVENYILTTSVFYFSGVFIYFIYIFNNPKKRAIAIAAFKEQWLRYVLFFLIVVLVISSVVYRIHYVVPQMAEDLLEQHQMKK